MRKRWKTGKEEKDLFWGVGIFLEQEFSDLNVTHSHSSLHSILKNRRVEIEIYMHMRIC